jgi:hypothetical protein
VRDNLLSKYGFLFKNIGVLLCRLKQDKKMHDGCEHAIFILISLHGDWLFSS